MSARLPLPPHPNSWWRVVDSDELGPGEVKPFHSFGRELVVYRGEDGAAHVVDAHCPHLGAHLGHGGRVVGDRLRCPFHGWEFASDGRCVEIPYCDRIPPKARIRQWPVCERNGIVFVWHHHAGEPPSFEIPVLPEWGSDAWTPPVKRHFVVKSHPQEMTENVVDPAHFQAVHGTPDPPATTACIDGHILRVESGIPFTTPQGTIPGKAEITSCGLGFGVTRFSGVIDTLLVISGGPVDEERYETTIRFMTRRLASEEAERNVARAFVDEIDRQYGQDIPIWENKVHLDRPLLCDGDGPIALVRRWAEQFYPPADRSAPERSAP